MRCHSSGHSSRGSETHVCAPPNGECVYAFVASALSITLFFMSPNKSHILAATIAARTLPSSWNTATSQFPSTTSLPRKTTRPFHLRRCSGFSVSESFSNHICNTIPMCILVSFCFARRLTSSHSSTKSSRHVSIRRSRSHSFRNAACAPGLRRISSLKTGRATQQFHGMVLFSLRLGDCM
jgi:hypothetical protein